MIRLIFTFSISLFYLFLTAQNDPTADSWEERGNWTETSDTVVVRNSFSVINGKLGVGTTASTEALHVNGGSIFRGIDNGASDNDWGSLADKQVRTMFSSRFNGIENGVHGFGSVSAHHFESPFIYGYESAGNKIVFGSVKWVDRNPATGLTPRLVINTDDGKVGIGTTDPQQELDVCGNIRAEEIVVEEGWCDYVFDERYQLPTLAEQEAFITQNGHLKNFQPESEMNGQIFIGDVSKRQQQTLEEMMLYLIELKAEIEQLKKENIALRSKATN